MISGTSGLLGENLAGLFLDLGSIVIGLDVKKKNIKHKNFFHLTVDISDEKSNINNLSTLALEAKLAVVVFDQQKEWAELFTQEIWKKIGGVSSGIPILLIGTNSNKPSKISIPNVTLAEAGKELLSLEIKIQYDSLTEN